MTVPRRVRVRGVLVLALLLPTSVPSPGGVGQWKTFTPKRDVRDLVSIGGLLWAATSGGLFSFDPASGAYAAFTTAEGLRTIDLTAIAADSTGALWIGAAGGELHRFRPGRGEWTFVSDIALLNTSRKRINAIRAWGDSLVVLHDAGLSVYSISRSEFADSYLRFGTGPGQLQGNVTGGAKSDGRLWVSTRSGVASIPLGSPAPTDPSSWRVWTTADGLPSASVRGLLQAGDSLYAATASGIGVWTGSGWRTVPGTAAANVLGIARSGGACAAAVYVTPASAGVVGPDGAARVVASSGGLVFSAVSAGGLVGTSGAGALRFDLCPPTGDSAAVDWRASPPGPPSEKFVSVAVDEGGWVWAATGNRNGEGFMSFDGSLWRSYTAADYPLLGSNEYYVVTAGPGNVKYVGGWGPGLAVVNSGNEIERVLNTSNGLPPTVGADPFVVVGGVATDRTGRTWLTARTPAGDTTLVTVDAGGGTAYVTGCMFELPDSSGVCMTRSPLRVLNDVVIDDFGTKWFANFGRFESEGARGLYYFNEGRDLPGTRGGWGKLTKLDGLPSDQVWSLAVDRFGDLWVGSEVGITIVTSPSNPRASIAPYRPLPDQIVQDILVDPLNRKWIATKRGVFLLSQDGTAVLERYTVENTGGRLLDDDVASIAIDPATGTVYFGTEQGLTSLATAAVAPVRTFETLDVFPNPFSVPAGSPLTVDGLVAGSSLKVFTVDGALVRDLDTPGGRVGFWDGTDLRGDVVSSGIYIVVAYSEAGTEVGSAKVAVVRR